MTKTIGCLIFKDFGQLSQVKSRCDPLKRMSTSNTELYVHHRRSASPETKTIGFWIFEEFGQMLPVTIVDKSLKGPWKDSKMKSFVRKTPEPKPERILRQILPRNNNKSYYSKYCPGCP